MSLDISASQVITCIKGPGRHLLHNHERCLCVSIRAEVWYVLAGAPEHVDGRTALSTSLSVPLDCVRWKFPPKVCSFPTNIEKKRSCGLNRSRCHAHSANPLPAALPIGRPEGVSINLTSQSIFQTRIMITLYHRFKCVVLLCKSYNKHPVICELKEGVVQATVVLLFKSSSWILNRLDGAIRPALRCSVATFSILQRNTSPISSASPRVD